MPKTNNARFAGRFARAIDLMSVGATIVELGAGVADAEDYWERFSAGGRGGGVLGRRELAAQGGLG